jgi:hypothetical protein
MGITFIGFDGWAPSGSYFGEGWNTVMNAYPAYGDWRPWRQFIPFAATKITGGPVNGSFAHLWNSGAGTGSYLPDAQTLFAGTPTSLYTVNPTTGAFTAVPRGAAYTASPAGWRYASVGNDIWAANWVDNLQLRAGNTGAFADGVTSAFKPKARFLATVREHLVAGNLSNAGRFPDELAWSDADAATNFDPPAAGSTSTSIAGSKRLVSIPGQLTGLVGGQYLLLFKRNAIYYGEYVGSPQTFNFDVLSPNIGTAFPSSIINSRYGIFFFGPDGFYRIEGLSAPQKISTPGIDRYFLALNLTVGSPYVAWEEDTQLEGFQLPHLPLIGWQFRFDIADAPNRQAIFYNPVTQAWSVSEVASQVEFSAGPTSLVTRPYAAEGLYPTLGAFWWDGTYSSYAPLSGSSDDVLAPTFELNFRPVNADSQSRQKIGNEKGQSTLLGVLPVFSKTVAAGDALTESVTAESFRDPHGAVTSTETSGYTLRDVMSGFYPFRIAGRFFRVTINCSSEDFASFAGCFVHTEELA